MMRRGVGRVGRPGLVGTMARTAVISGTATAVSGKVAAKQHAAAQAAAQQQAAQAPTAPAAAPAPVAEAPAPSGDDGIEQIKKLAELRDAGILTEEEFSAKKAQILGI